MFFIVYTDTAQSSLTTNLYLKIEWVLLYSVTYLLILRRRKRELVEEIVDGWKIFQHFEGFN